MARTDPTPSAPNPLRFSPIPVAVLKDDTIPHGAKVLLGVILDFAWSDSSTWVSVEKLAEVMGHGVRTIQMWMTSLKGHGWIRFEPDPSVKTGRRIVLVWREGEAPGGAGAGVPEAPEDPGPGRGEARRKSLRSQCNAPDSDSPDRGRRRSTTTDPGPAQDREPKPKRDVVGNEQGREEPDAGSRTTATSSTVEQLVGSGVTRSVAEALASKFGDDQVSRQIEALPHRKPKDRAATLVSSIREDWALPEELRRAGEKAARHSEERERRAREESIKRARRLDEEKVSRFWASLTPGERERFVEEAIEHAVPEQRDLIRSLKPHEPLYRAHRAVARDEHIRRKLGLEVRD
ncbi:helix-turn-helix domain-containing protein [Paludisphaera sp.]|uniref:helix-turn-helix domain-containing protein n=1 Tax=Paludisphaera sp. TaxID=2017432 RepID=UPI00301C34B1